MPPSIRRRRICGELREERIMAENGVIVRKKGTTLDGDGTWTEEIVHHEFAESPLSPCAVRGPCSSTETVRPYQSTRDSKIRKQLP